MTIRSPYRTEDCSGGSAEMLERVKKVVTTHNRFSFFLSHFSCMSYHKKAGRRKEADTKKLFVGTSQMKYRAYSKKKKKVLVIIIIN